MHRMKGDLCQYIYILKAMDVMKQICTTPFCVQSLPSRGSTWPATSDLGDSIDGKELRKALLKVRNHNN